MRHVSWPQLMPLSLRLRAAIAILDTGECFEAFADDAMAALVLGELDRAVTGEMGVLGRTRRSEQEAQLEGPALDAYYARVGAELAKKTGSVAGGSPLAAQLTQSLRQVCASTVCQTCAAGASPVYMCQWTRKSEAEDDRTVAGRGACLQVLSELFTFTKDLAASAYQNACRKCQVIVFELHSGHDERSSELDIAIHGVTTENATAPLRVRVVRLRFCAESVGVEDYLSLPYVLLHECLVHGLCGVNIEAPEAVLSTAFHEGWMDCVASEVLKSALSVAPAGHLVGRHATQFGRQTEQVRNTRFKRNRAGRAKDVLKWILGESAFHTMLRLFDFSVAGAEGETNAASAIQAQAELLRFSLALNHSGLSHETRGKFVRSLQRHYVRGEPAHALAALQQRPQVIDFIDEYRVTMDYSKLVKKLIAIR
jgi:hypothetical protein